MNFKLFSFGLAATLSLFVYETAAYGAPDESDSGASDDDAAAETDAEPVADAAESDSDESPDSSVDDRGGSDNPASPGESDAETAGGGGGGGASPAAPTSSGTSKGCSVGTASNEPAVLWTPALVVGAFGMAFARRHRRSR